MAYQRVNISVDPKVYRKVIEQKGKIPFSVLVGFWLEAIAEGNEDFVGPVIAHISEKKLRRLAKNTVKKKLKK
jgi:hypothetical protein